MKIKQSILSAVCFATLLFGQEALGQARLVNVDLKQVKGHLNQSFKVCVGAGRAAEGLRADWQRQLRQTHKDCGFTYIRFHGLLNDEMAVYKEDKDGKPIYNYQYVDELYDFLLSIKMKPFVELAFMPTALASGDGTVFWWKGNKTPPKDYQKWHDLVKNLVKHFEERYGHDEVASWYFEVWNEPNLKSFFSGDQAEYNKLYRESALAVKEVSKDYRVGGPGSAAGGNYLPDLIKFCAETKTPIDFASTHVYGVKKGRIDETGETGHIISTSKDAVYSYMVRMSNVVKASVMPNLELHFTEWSSSYSPVDNIHDSYHNAAFVLDKIKHAGPYLKSMSYWTFTDIFEELGPPMTPFHGGFGLMNLQDIKKPTYYAYKFLNALGATELRTNDSCAIAATGKNGSAQLLLWDFTITHPGGNMLNQIFYTRDQPAKAQPPVKVSVKNLPAGSYKLNVYRVGYRSNDAFMAYFDMGRPSQLTKAQVLKIKEQSSGAPYLSSVVRIDRSGNFIKELPMRENDVYLVTLDKLIR